ncbi:hypothetical protein KY290_006891 [Solanum tuberosum]|uniref:Uncharacterized protein n=1 Tax=Solanum tuberosum TaxID=4113 RepID=A0ABQ7W421_SOLTU|nr:hypothetical protein KY284_006930 [Solanum tuberosum]KAH0745078.1 hypothetical protein KY285_006735 [Solanum tuberosum]KAH0775480.1 hypothetical protein KY290_006891 [Solanum tuberosum]
MKETNLDLGIMELWGMKAEKQDCIKGLQGMSFTYKPMHCLTRSRHLIFGIPCIPPEEDEETSWGIAGLCPRWLI